jgi:transcriptional regulator with XRE-family HTH domain
MCYNDVQQKKGGIIMAIGSTIRALREEMGLTQDEFGDRIGIHGRQLGKYEIGTNTPSIDIIVKIAKFCEVSTDYIIYGQDSHLAERLKMKDPELIAILRKIDRLKKSERERVKWALHGLLNNNK